MGCFISYSRPDAGSVRAIGQDLKSSGHQVWLDQELSGGAQWWRMILQQIRSSDVFIFALSQNWVRSKPCQQEYAYAKALGIPLLPVQVGPVENIRTSSIGQIQLVDYRQGSKEAFISLLNAVENLSKIGWTPPAQLPPEPPVPYEYLMRLGDRLSARELSSDSQMELLDQLRRELEVEADDRARDDLMDLLATLRSRGDVTYRTATEVDAVLSRNRRGTPVHTPDFTGPAVQTTMTQAEPPRVPPPVQERSQPSVAAPANRHVAPAQPGKAPALSIIAFVLGAIGILFVPLLFGGAGIVCAAIGLSRKEKPAKVALIFTVIATVAGLILGAIVGSMAYGGY
jgi:serine/threonine kinase PknH